MLMFGKLGDQLWQFPADDIARMLSPKVIECAYMRKSYPPLVVTAVSSMNLSCARSRSPQECQCLDRHRFPHSATGSSAAILLPCF